MFPKIYYNLSTTVVPDVTIVLDITRRIKLRDIIINASVFYDLYLIQDTDTPEIVSDRFYGSPFYHWIIMLANDIIDVKTDWPMNNAVFEQYIINTYDLNKLGAHHYVNADGLEVDASTIGATPVSNYDYEMALNDSKRAIKIVKPDLLDSVVNQFQVSILKE